MNSSLERMLRIEESLVVFGESYCFLITLTLFARTVGRDISVRPVESKKVKTTKDCSIALGTKIGENVPGWLRRSAQCFERHVTLTPLDNISRYHYCPMRLQC